MKLLIKLIASLFFVLIANVNASELYFNEAKELFKKEKYEDSKFLFQRSIVFNPKHSKSYLYLAKIFNIEKNEKEEIKNLNTTLLLEPDNEEATYLLIEVELKRSNYSRVKKLKKDFQSICLKLCEKLSSIDIKLEDIETKK
tara:strand:- start:781 stop:1206 length:426 start_codon:yes stop_codon:yes gene_type:complete